MFWYKLNLADVWRFIVSLNIIITVLILNRILNFDKKKYGKF